MGTAAPAIMVVLAAIGTEESVRAGQNQQAALDRQADQEAAAAADVAQRGEHAAALAREKGGRLEARQRAIIGATGTTAGGSYSGVLGGTEAAVNDDVLTLRANAAREAWGHQATAAGYSAQARAVGTASMIQAGSSLLGGLSEAGKYKHQLDYEKKMQGLYAGG